MLTECEFLIVGNKSSLYAKDIQKQIEDLLSVKMLGTVDREKIHELLSDSDILICPSREDSMLTVCAEAMMHSVPCLVSDVIRTVEYIKDGYDGLIFANESSIELHEKICWCINNKHKLNEMGKNALDIYERVFLMEVFEKSLWKYIDEMIG